MTDKSAKPRAGIDEETDSGKAVTKILNREYDVVGGTAWVCNHISVSTRKPCPGRYDTRASGLFYVPVEQEGNRNASEESKRVAEIVNELIKPGVTWTNPLGDLRPGLSGNDIEAFVDRLIDVVEARSLAFGGGAGRDDKLEGFVTRAGRGSATDEDRAVLAAFLAGDQEIARHEVGALRDAWHGWD